MKAILQKLLLSVHIKDEVQVYMVEYVTVAKLQSAVVRCIMVDTQRCDVHGLSSCGNMLVIMK